MKQLTVVPMIMALLPIFLMGTETIPLKELSRPSIFKVKYGNVYILQDVNVFIYSLKDFSLKKKFGKAGEGPREFKMNPNDARPMTMSFYKDIMHVDTLGKISYFDREGNYIKEVKVTVDQLLFQIGDKYLGIGPIPDDKGRQHVCFTFWSKDFTTRNILFRSDLEVGNPQRLLLPIPTFTYNPIYKDKIYINSSSREFKIDVYDITGRLIQTISKDYPKLEIPSTFRDEALKFIKLHPRWKQQYEAFKRILEIRDYYPPIRDIQLVDDTIHVLTYNRKGKSWECIMLDLQGNEKGRTFIHLGRYEFFSFYPILYSIYQGKVYTLVEDEEDEVWKVHVTDLK